MGQERQIEIVELFSRAMIQSCKFRHLLSGFFLLASIRNKQSFLASQILVIYFGCSIVNLTIFCQLEYFQDKEAFQGFNITSLHFKLKFYFLFNI